MPTRIAPIICLIFSLALGCKSAPGEVLLERNWAVSSPDGSLELFADFPFAQEVLMAVPAAWEDTLLLDGHPDSHIALARRSGETWYVGGINGTVGELPISFSPSFLTGDAHKLSAIVDHSTDIELNHESSSVDPTATYSHTLPANGGFLLVYEPG